MIMGNRLAHLAYVRHLEVPTDMLVSEKDRLNSSVMNSLGFMLESNDRLGSVFAGVVLANGGLKNALYPGNLKILTQHLMRGDQMSDAVRRVLGNMKNVLANFNELLDNLFILDWERPVPSEDLADELLQSLPDEGGHYYIEANCDGGVAYGMRECYGLAIFGLPGRSATPGIMQGNTVRLCNACGDGRLARYFETAGKSAIPVVTWHDVTIDFIDSVIARGHKSITGETLVRREKHLMH